VADRIVNVITPADSYDLVSLDELKLIIQVPPTDTSQDAALAEYITQYSDIISTLCDRVFGYEEVSEVWTCTDQDDDCSMKRLFMSRYPIDTSASIDVEAPAGSLLDPTAYSVEKKSGKIELLEPSDEPVTVTYHGGYQLPDNAPPALKQATILMVREGQALMNRLAVTGIRSISHKDSRVMYFDSSAVKAPLGRLSSAGMVGDAINNLLMRYVRFEV
jgi:hypothetical protein